MSGNSLFANGLRIGQTQFAGRMMEAVLCAHPNNIMQNPYFFQNSINFSLLTKYNQNLMSKVVIQNDMEAGTLSPFPHMYIFQNFFKRNFKRKY